MLQQSQYGIYKILIYESKEKNLFLKHTDGTTMLEHAQEHFGSLFGGCSLNLYKTKEDGEVTKYPNDILNNEGDIIVLRVNNVQFKSLVKRKETGSPIPQYEEVKEESNPFCYVIIDNRDGVLQMAIEKSASWGGNTDAVRDLLQDCLNSALVNTYGLELKIMNKMQPTKFWQFVRQQYMDNEDYIETFIIDLINPKKATVDKSAELKGIMKQLSGFLEKMDALDATLSVNTNSTGYIGDNKKIKRDFVNIVDLCSCNGYHLGCKFHKLGYYACNDKVMAYITLPEGTVMTFVSRSKDLDLEGGNQEGEYGLTKWLDAVREQTKNYEYAESIPKKPKRRRKK